VRLLLLCCCLTTPPLTLEADQLDLSARLRRLSDDDVSGGSFLSGTLWPGKEPSFSLALFNGPSIGLRVSTRQTRALAERFELALFAGAFVPGSTPAAAGAALAMVIRVRFVPYLAPPARTCSSYLPSHGAPDPLAHRLEPGSVEGLCRLEGSDDLSPRWALGRLVRLASAPPVLKHLRFSDHH
jgi:hypothetical protein